MNPFSNRRGRGSMKSAPQAVNLNSHQPDLMHVLRRSPRLVRNITGNNLEEIRFTIDPTSNTVTVEFKGNGQVVNTLEMTPARALDVHSSCIENGFGRHIFMTNIAYPA